MGIKITEINIIGLFLFVLFGMEVFLSISFITAYLPAICFYCCYAGSYAGDPAARKSRWLTNLPFYSCREDFFVIVTFSS